MFLNIVRFVNVGASSGQENIDLPSSVLLSSAVQILGSGLGSVIMPKFFEAIQNVFKVVKTANLQVNTKVVPLSSVESVWGDSSGKPRVVFWIVNSKSDNFIKGFLTILNRCQVSQCSVNPMLVEPVDVIVQFQL